MGNANRSKKKAPTLNDASLGDLVAATELANMPTKGHCTIDRVYFLVAEERGLRGWTLPGRLCAKCHGRVADHHRVHPDRIAAARRCDIEPYEFTLAEEYNIRGWILPGRLCAKCSGRVDDHRARGPRTRRSKPRRSKPRRSKPRRGKRRRRATV